MLYPALWLLRSLGLRAATARGGGWGGERRAEAAGDGGHVWSRHIRSPSSFGDCGILPASLTVHPSTELPTTLFSESHLKVLWLCLHLLLVFAQRDFRDPEEPQKLSSSPRLLSGLPSYTLCTSALWFVCLITAKAAGCILGRYQSFQIIMNQRFG